MLEGPESRKTPAVSNLCSAKDTENKRLHAEYCYMVILNISPSLAQCLLTVVMGTASVRGRVDKSEYEEEGKMLWVVFKHV